MRSSIRDVAQRAGVSPMTVSNVLRRRTGRLSEETRQRVLQALQELNYIPVRPAMQNRHITTHAIGVVFFQTLQAFCRAADAVGDVGAGQGAGSRPADGPALPAGLAGAGCGRPIPGPAVRRIHPRRGPTSRRCRPCWRPRNSGIGMLQRLPAARGGAGGGWTTVGRCGRPWRCCGTWGTGGSPTWAARSATARRICACRHSVRAMREQGAAGRACRAGRHLGRSAHGHSAECHPGNSGCTAVVCANDALALELWRVAEERGRRVPEDLSITGMDNTEEGAACGD